MSFFDIRVFINDKLSIVLAVIAGLFAVLAWLFPSEDIKKHRLKILSCCLLIYALLIANAVTLNREPVSVQNENPMTRSMSTSISNVDGKSKSSIFGSGIDGELTVYHGDMLYISIEKQGLLLLADSKPTWELGYYPNSGETVSASLINYDTGVIVSNLQGYIGKKILFKNIEPGKYYFLLSSEGYEDYYPAMPFIIENDGNNMDIPTIYSVMKAKRDIITHPIKIKVLNADGNLLQNIKCICRVTNISNPAPDTYSPISAQTNSKGELIILWRDDALNYDVEYIMASECIVQISMNGEDFIDSRPTSENEYSITVN